jgi:dynein heavy chain
MDDNKVLTLVSQERIPLTPPMRLMLEVSHLKNATPATVSRGGVLFVNDSDVGWRPFFDSWIVKYKKDPNEDIADSVFQLALSTYLSDNFIDDLRGKSHITPVCDMQCVQSMAMILDKLYERLHTIKAQNDFLKRLKEEGQVDRIKEIYEAFFVFAAMWAWGASLDEDRGSFSNSIKSLTNGNLKFPEAGYTFDYFYDVIEGKWTHWDEVVGDYNKEFEGLFENLVVPTADTTRNSFLLDLHVSAKKGMIYVGKAGTGKTTIISNYFDGLDKDSTLTSSMNFNSYTDSGALQVVLESGVDKRAGKTYGPPPSKTLIYFLDDMNMPYLDKYGTQSPICLIRQIIDYGVVYDRDHLEDKKYLVDIMFTGCMNPKSGSFIIDLRLTRHSTLVACLTSEREILKTIYF